MSRVWHPFDLWECVAAGMYAIDTGHAPDDARRAYADFLRDTPRFEAALRRVLSEWPVSCEHFLSNDSINRIAWLGQAAMCIATGVPRWYCAGFLLLTHYEQRIANATAGHALTTWLQRQQVSIVHSA